MKKENVFAGANSEKKFIMYDLKSGDIFHSENRYYKLDPENFHFDELDARVKKISREKIQKFLDSKNIKFDTEAFIYLFCFQNYIREVFPNYTKNADADIRHVFAKKYKSSETNPMLLSIAFKEKIVSCAEMALVAQMYLQHCGITSFLYGGSAFFHNKIPNNSSLRGDAHAFLNIKVKDKSYFYDPVNPIIIDKYEMPAIMDYSGVSKKEKLDFVSKLLRGVPKDSRGAVYIEARDIYNSGRNWLYGFDVLNGNTGLARMENGAIKRYKETIR